ncbi:MAG: Hint domain-containing protein [Rhodobacter sp.]|nr:Hint domain-containing protein [Rhodobacter sp.]
MMTGFRGTFVISWSQTELDGLAGAPLGSLSVGASWSWHGQPVRIDGPGNILVLGQSEETASLRKHAARAVRRLVGAALELETVSKLPEPDDPVLETGFAVTDGIRCYTATIIDVPEGRGPLLMFLDDVPPAGQDLWITHITDQSLHPNRSGDPVPSVICFTPDTRIATPDGPRRVRDLREDDRVLTKDDGPQPIRWIGQRRMSGARLYAMPELRPIRIRAGAAGDGRPDEDLLVSPEHRLLLKGPNADALFGTSEVLVTAKDMIDDRAIRVDRQLGEVTYVHILLDRHQIVFANGLESETFHPASMPVDALDPMQRTELAERVPGIDRDPSLYGAFARRTLTTAEAAILRFRGEHPH